MLLAKFFGGRFGDEKRPSQLLLVQCSFDCSHRSVFDVGQNLQDFWRQRDRICKAVAACSQYDNLESVVSEIKLKGHVAVHGDEQLKASFFGFL